jgi:hypothetical protein
MIATVKKALYAAGFGTAGATGTALLDGALTGAELLAAVGAGLLAGVVVYKATNAPSAE